MRVCELNGIVDVIVSVKRNGRPVYERRRFRSVPTAGETEEELINNFRFYKSVRDKDCRKELSKIEKEGKIKLVCFSIERILGLQGLAPGYSVVEK